METMFARLEAVIEQYNALRAQCNELLSEAELLLTAIEARHTERAAEH